MDQPKLTQNKFSNPIHKNPLYSYSWEIQRHRAHLDNSCILASIIVNHNSATTTTSGKQLKNYPQPISEKNNNNKIKEVGGVQ